MKWGKTVLMFQAFATLFVGMAFLVQVINLDTLEISELNIEVSSGVTIGGEDAETAFIDIKKRYTVAAYMLLVIAFVELLIVTRLIS